MEEQAEYHVSTEHVTRTQLKTFIESREDYYHQYVKKDVPREEPSKAMLDGQVLHAVLLESKPLVDIVVPYPKFCLKSNGAINPTAAREFEANNAGKYCVKLDEFERLVKLIDAVSQTELFHLVASAHCREHTFFGEFEGRKIKAKMDFVGELDEAVCVYDLKFVENHSPALFTRNCRRLRYWLQDAHYSAVMRANTVKPVRFRFCAVECAFPYRLNWYEYDPRSREIANDAWARAMNDLISCEASGEYVDSHQHTLTVERWDLGDLADAEEEELVGFSDE